MMAMSPYIWLSPLKSGCQVQWNLAAKSFLMDTGTMNAWADTLPMQMIAMKCCFILIGQDLMKVAQTMDKSLTTCLVISHISFLTQEKSAAKSFTIGITILVPVSHQLPLETIILIGVGVQPLPVSMITECQPTCDQLKVSRGISQQPLKVVANASSHGIRRSA